VTTSAAEAARLSRRSCTAAPRQEKLSAKRIAEAERLMNEVGGEEGHQLALKALSGELPKLEFTGKELAATTSPPVQAHSGAPRPAAVRAGADTDGAAPRVLDGKVPTRSEIKLLGDAFGEEDAAKLAGSVGPVEEARQHRPAAAERAARFEVVVRPVGAVPSGTRARRPPPAMFASEFKPMVKRSSRRTPTRT
jgi:hypothetical protein